MEIPYCRCSNTCSRAGKRGACPCRVEGRFCECGHLVPCINRTEKEVSDNFDSSGDEWMAETLSRKRHLDLLEPPAIPAKIRRSKRSHPQTPGASCQPSCLQEIPSQSSCLSQLSDQPSCLPCSSSQSSSLPQPSILPRPSGQSSSQPRPFNQLSRLPQPSSQSSRLPRPSSQSSHIPVPSNQSTHGSRPSSQSTRRPRPSSQLTRRARSSKRPATSQASNQPSSNGDLGLERRSQVKDYLDTLSDSKAKELLGEMLLRDNQAFLDCVGGYLTPSLDDEGFSPDHNPDPFDGEVPGWCRCGNCRTMPTDVENRCCTTSRAVPCITTQATFRRVVMDEAVLDVAGAYRNDMYVYEHRRNNRMFRHTAYRQFILMKYGVLRKGERKVVPSFCVLTIRRRYPDPEQRYTVFVHGRY